MATRRTLDFLPSIFQTDTNRKFLAATLDQLVSEPAFVKLNGYVGRKFAPTYKTTDSYVTEINDNRQNYQLEPSVIIKNSSNEIEFYSNYPDLINKIAYYGGTTVNHDRLFDNEYYTFDGLFDQDKFVNYQQYFWLPNGPAPINITAEFVQSQKTFTFINDDENDCLKVDGREDNNPEIVVSRGGLYKFVVNQIGHNIYIQTEPGVSGIKSALQNQSSRDVYGVTNNGTDSGIIELRIPLSDAQDVYLKMPHGPTVDYAVDLRFTNIDGAVWDDIVAQYNGFDSVTFLPIDKTIILTNFSNDDNDWKCSDGTVVAETLRNGVYRINIVRNENQQNIINLTYLADVDVNTRIYIRLGKNFANREFYLNATSQYIQIPALTAQLDTLYYQDASNPTRYGKIRLVNSSTDNINITTSVLGKKNYTSPTGIDFTNGMLLSFDHTIEPVAYANKSFIVEGVGKSIRLVDFSNLVYPEPGLSERGIEWGISQFDSNSFDGIYQGPPTPDYIVMNRSSLDLNAWARQNRWFHIDVINKSAELNNEVPVFDQAIRAQRPIIEYENDIQLFNNGRIGKTPVDHIDTTHTNAFNQIQHRMSLTDNGISLKKGQRILFANDNDPLVRSQVYVVQFINQSEQSYQSVYDGKGDGTISIDAPTIDYLSVGAPTLTNSPELDETNVPTATRLYSWTWTVQGSRKILSAIRIAGLHGPTNANNGIITNVTLLEGMQYNIAFTTTFPITEFDSSTVDLIAPGGIVTIIGNNTNFFNELEAGTEIYANDNVYIGTISSIMQANKAQLELPSTAALTNSNFWYKKPRIQLLISKDPADALLPYDTLVAKTGENKGKTFWYNGTSWKLAQLKDRINKPIMFDAFDTEQKSFSEYSGSKFIGTKIFSYKVGTGAVDSVLGFPIAYTSNYSIADITFSHDFSNDSFQYLIGNTTANQKIELGYLRQNLNRTDFVNRNTWATVSEPSHQYQIISKTYTGETNYFEIDITGKNPIQNPTIKVFLNNKLLNSTQYTPYVAVKTRNTVVIPVNLLTVNDKVDILIYSAETSDVGYYQIPYNLEYNSKNESFNTITLGQLRNNLNVIGQNIAGIIGSVPGNSNLRDINISECNGNILQSSAPLIYANLFLINETSNFVNSIEYARKEYSKFKNKFLEMCSNLKGLDITNPKVGVDTILTAINSIKNKSFPWYYSDMVPYGDAKTISYPVIDTSQRRYKIQTVFDDTQIQSRAVLIYLNNQQLVKDIDYQFDKSSPAIELAETVITVPGDIIEIKDYATTDANFIPETPTKLGLYQKFSPQIFTDDTYREPTIVIQGHDGSLTPSFEDFRDQFLLELEKRIFNNIKDDPTKKVIDLRTLIPGRFRTVDYSLVEYNNILNTSFLKWAGSNKVNFTTNKYFVNGDPFTYNYQLTKDSLFSEFLPGYWRGIYQYFYDTDKPHSHPWEMLGFADQPTWWQTVYGPSPYTKDNTLLWDDLEAGIIRQGSRAGIDKNYSRPGLSQVLPVDASGNLLPPMTNIATPLNTQTVEQSFKVGDCGPVESAWRRTSEFPYAVQIAAALMKPAMYFGTLMDTNSYYKSDFLNQYLCAVTNNRITPTSIVINGELVNKVPTRAKGYINWIVDYMTSTGINGTAKLRSLLDSLQVQLSYKSAGFVDKKYLTILAEQYSPASTNESVIIPDDSYKIHLNKSVPTDRITYSAVIIEKTNTGYSISGYNLNNPYFAIIPSEIPGDKYTINVDGTNAVIYKSFRKEKLYFPYGTEFNTKQQVVDFLVSYQRLLISQGFIFDEYDSELAQLKDWVLSVREFITWAGQGWKAGSVLILSPVNNTLNVVTTNSVVDQINNTNNGSKLLDPNFNAIRTTEISVLRDNGDFKVTSIAGKTIAFAEFNLVQFEHALLFDNNTIFNDIVYKPETGSRQFRLKLVGNKTDNWDGSLSAPGFIYNSSTVAEWRGGKDFLKGDLVLYKRQYYVATQNIVASTVFDINYWKQIPSTDIKTGLLSNFSNNAGKFVNFYDVDSSVLDSQIAQMSNGLIGFRSRPYLTDLNINQTSQTKFYQGLIKNKGTGKSITNLVNATFSDLTNDVSYYEEWAMRVGEYGAIDSNSTVEIILNEQSGKQNPLGLCISDTIQEDGIITINNNDLYNRSYEPGPIAFINRKINFISEVDIQSAGYVNVDDVNATLFDLNDYQNLNSKIDEIISGYKIWVGKDYNKDWNVYRASETNTQIEKIEYNLDNVAKVITKDPHYLNSNQLVAMRNFNPLFNGFYVINEILGGREFTVSITKDQSQLLKKKPISSSGLLFVMNSVRFNSPDEIDNFTPRHGWKDNDLVWVDYNENDRWSVIKKFNPWTYSRNLPIQLGVTRSEIDYGASIKINNEFVIVGAPGDRNGVGRIHVFNRKTLKEIGVIAVGDYNNIAGLGQCLDQTNQFLIVGAPTTEAQRGAVVIYRFQDNTVFIPSQIITVPTQLASVGAKFGYSLNQSLDGKWLYIGAPGQDSVYVFSLVPVRNAYNSFSASSFRTGCELPYTVTDARSLAVYYKDIILKPIIDYYLTNNTIKFLNIPMDNLTGVIVVARRSFYEYKYVQRGPSSTEFGYSIKTNNTGSLVIVGAPAATVDNVVQAGKTYVYTNNLLADTLLTQSAVLSLPNSTYRARFGTDIDYAHNTGSMYVGAPGYSTFTYSGGIVNRYVFKNGQYSLAQEIRKPIDLAGENFGSVIKVSANDTRLVVSSTRGTAKTTSIIDKKETTFDGSATTYIDITPGTGAVYLYEYLPTNPKFGNPYGNYIFGVEFNAPQLNKGDQFGCSIEFDNNELYIGASYNDTYGTNAGAVYLEYNATGSPVWSTSRTQTHKVEPNSINSISLYNKVTKSKLANLDYIDPAKGKSLGIIEQNLNYKTSRDPAIYNAGTTVKDTASINFHWGAQHVGQTWWNLDTIRYIDYEQDTLIYRLNNWGNLFPGSTVSVYEWVESELTPSQYAANLAPGVPLYPDDNSYVQISYADPSSGAIKIKYYFWVSGITTVATGVPRTLSIQGIEDAIRNPKKQSIPYAALLANNSIALFNCDRYISSADIILKIDYDIVSNTNLIHSEFQLFQESNPTSQIPTKLVTKIIDSLAGADSLLRRVPDPKLKPSQSLGLETRPRQTLIADRFMALKNAIKFVNSIFKTTTAAYKLQNSEKFESALWFSADPAPTKYDHLAANLTELSYIDLIAGKTILVEKNDNYFGLWTLHLVQDDLSLKLISNQTYRTTDLWEYQNWYKDGFDENTVPDYIVDYYKDIEKLVIRPGNIVQVNNSSTKGFEIYVFTSQNNSELVAVENGTLKINDTVWDTSFNEVGFDNHGFEGAPYDKDRSIEYRNLFIGLISDIFIDDLASNYNELLFTVIRYILSEQQNVDWIFKTSFISVLHKIKQLEQYPNFVKDNHTYYEDYINEIKPYRTKIRDYKISYDGKDTSYAAVSDFDLPGYYDRELNRFRSPSGEIPAKDSLLLMNPEYADWANNFSYGLESVTIRSGGYNYSKQIQVKIIANLDAGTGATATAVVNEVTGAITKIHVTNPGTGYRNTPHVFISGIGNGAIVYAQLSNRKVRSIKTIIKFDRVSYTTDVREWQSNVVYNTSEMVSYQGKGYKAKFTNSGAVFNLGNFIPLSGNDYTTANDRLAGTYYPGPNQIQKDIDDNGNIDLTRLIPGLSYDANVVQSHLDVFSESEINSPKAFDRNTGRNPADINIVGSKFADFSKAYAPEELVAGSTFDNLNMCVSTIITDPRDSTRQKVVKYRILKDTNDDPTYIAVSNEGSARLVKDLYQTDTLIYLDSLDGITLPNTRAKIPGYLYVNGEKIKFWRTDATNNTILYPIRGVECTGIPTLHSIGSLVEDQSPNYNIPDITTVDWAQFIFTAESPVFKPFFKVNSNLLYTSTRLSIFNSATKLTYGIDYTLEISSFGGVFITFTQAALIKDGVKFDASYTKEISWLNIGNGTPTDGAGLNGSTTASANFMKRYTHDLP